MVQLRGSESLISIIKRAQALDDQPSHPTSNHVNKRSETTNSTDNNHDRTQHAIENDVISEASFYVPALPAASSSNLVLSPMYSGHLPAAYPLDAQSRDIIPDDAVSDAHLFFVSYHAQSLHSIRLEK